MTSAEAIRALREQTGAGMMDCKKALNECGEDFEKAGDWLREKGITKAAAKSGRMVGEGVVALARENKTTALLELNCETDFVAKNDTFVSFAGQAAAAAAKHKPKDAEAALEMTLEGGKLGDKLPQLVAKLGENIRLRRLSIVEGDFQASYLHNRVGDSLGKIAVVVKLDKEDQIGEAVAMHVAAFSPLALSKEDIDRSLVEKERNLLTKQAEREGGNRPPEIVARMIEGRLEKWFKEVVLLEQPFVLDDKKSVGKALEEAGAKALSFVRMQVGEGA